MSSTTLPDSTSSDSLQQALAAWRRQVESELNGVPFDKKLLTRTPEGLTLRPLYTRADVAGLPHLHDAPGDAPYVRGFRPPHGPIRWECAQEICADTIGEFNRALRVDLNGGQDSVVLAPDLASRAGLDPQDAPADWVNAAGLSFASAESIEAALRGVDLDAVSLHLDTGAMPLPLGALVLAEARTRGMPLDHLRGSITADPIALALQTGSLPTTWSESMDQLAGWSDWARRTAPRLRTIGVNASLWRESGGAATHELAYALAAALAYLRAMTERKLALADIVPQFRFTFAADASFFVEVAKFRAWRLVWTKLIVALGAAPELATTIAVHARTARWNQSLLDVHANMLRGTTAALSAVLGGVDSLHVAPWDEVSGRTHDASRRVARNVHPLLAEEFRTTAPIDAAGGSWYVESLTDDLARKAWALFQEVEGAGGMLAAIERGAPQAVVAAAAHERNTAFATRKQGLVGTNVFPNAKDKLPAGGRSPRVPGRTIVGRSCSSKAPSGRAATPSSAWSDRVMASLAAARDGATVGQLAQLVTQGSAGVQIAPLAIHRAAEPFERLRARSANLKERPRVLLAKMGPPTQHKARADFSAGFFAVGGFEVMAKQTFERTEDAVQATIDAGVRVVVLCSADETYPELVPAFAQRLKAARADVQVILAGLPADAAVRESYRAAGIDDFIHVRANVVEVLGKLLNRFES